MTPKAALCFALAIIVGGHKTLAWPSLIATSNSDVASQRTNRQRKVPTGPSRTLLQEESNDASQVAPANCSLAFDDDQYIYVACVYLQGLPADSPLTVHWTAPESGAAGQIPSEGVALDMALTGTVPTCSWVALGFPETPGQMVGSNAIVMADCPACPEGFWLRNYFLGGKSSAAVVVGDELALDVVQLQRDGNTQEAKVVTKTNIAFIMVMVVLTEDFDGIINNFAPFEHAMQSRFTIQLPASAIDPSGNVAIIYAAGPLGSDGERLQYHDVRQTGALNLASGAATTADESSLKAKKNAHAWLMAIGWTILLAGAVVARSFRAYGRSRWFQIHRAAQLIGLVTGLSSFILIFEALDHEITSYRLHFNLGVAATTLGLAQVTALVYRPHLDSRWRRIWALSHHWIGRSAVVLAIANIYVGMIDVKNVASGYVVAFSIVMGVIIGIGAVKEGVDYLRLPPPALLQNASDKKHGSVEDEEDMRAAVEMNEHR